MEHITSKNISLPRPSAVAIGQFDALHKGHMALIAEMTAGARERGLSAVIFSFYPSPSEIFGDKRDYTFTSREKIEILSGLGIDYFIEYPFDRAFALIPPKDFLRGFLYGDLKCRLIAAGGDFCFGKDRAGDMRLIKETAAEFGFEVTELPAVSVNGAAVSSGRVRAALADSDFAKARALMGRAFFMSGAVGEGKKIGSKLGFPTANIEIPAGKFCPADGVYITACETYDKHIYPSVTNIGGNPSFGNVKRRMETFLLDYSGTLYNRPVKIRFYKRLRGETIFKDTAALTAQIANDTEQAREWWRENSGILNE